MKIYFKGIFLVLISISSTDIFADPKPDQSPDSSIEEVVVFGLPLGGSNIQSAQPVNVISAAELHSKQASTLGETLKYEVGVQSSNYGGVSSSPIIRGLDGPRVLISQNGLDVGDVSRVGPDHGVTTEASTAEQIEVLRGPATLFYGSGAIGGVVNIVDDRVPWDNTSKLAALAEYSSVNHEQLLSVAKTSGQGAVAYHLDAFKRSSDDYRIAGPAHVEHPEERNGYLENSLSNSKGGNVGLSYLFDTGYIGMSYGRLEKFNGVPGHSHADDEYPEHEETLVFSDMLQHRWQLIGQYDIDNEIFKSITSRAAYTDYQHNEIERTNDINAIGTIFKSQTVQWRGEFEHQDIAGWQGMLVPSHKRSEFAALGDEAFTPASSTTEKALAIIEEYRHGDILWQAGIRRESMEITLDSPAILASAADINAPIVGTSFSYTPTSASLGLVWDFAAGYNFGISMTKASRAPTSAELLSYGSHLATRSFEIGALYELQDQSASFQATYLGHAKLESSRNLDVSIKKFTGDTGFVINVFYNEIDDYFAQQNLGMLSDNLASFDAAALDEHLVPLPVHQFVQTDAKLYGAEMEFNWQINDALNMSIWGDTVTAKMTSGNYLPRSPASRLALDLEYRKGKWQSELHILRYFSKNNLAQYETTTAGSTIVDARFDYQLRELGEDVHTYVAMSNVLDKNIRNHTSFLKDMAPLPARNIKVGISYYF